MTSPDVARASTRATTTNQAECTIPRALTTLQEDLGELNRFVARQFLSLAEALQSISGHARDIAGLSREVTGLAADEESDGAIGTLRHILADSERMQVMAETSREKMQEILQRLNESRSALSYLAKMRVMLQVFGMLSRIEGSRLRNTAVDVAGLAADIRHLAEQIECHVTMIEEEVARLAELVAHSGQQLNQARGQEQQQAADLINRTQAVLAQLHERAEASRAAALSIDAQYASIRSATDKIVMALQSEDLARQRMEHVQEAIRQASVALESGESTADCARILILQRSQVLSTRDMLSDSIRSIHDSLRSLGPRLEALTAQTAALASQTEEDGLSFAAGVEAGLATVSSVFGQYLASSRAVGTTVDTVLPSLALMATGTNKLEEIEFSVRLISLNAIVKSEQLGAEGAAISTIATQLEKFSAQSEGYTHAVLESLRAIEIAVQAISGHTTTSATSLLTSFGVDDVKSELSRLTNAVEISNQAISAKLATLLGMAGKLQTELRRSSEIAEQGITITGAFDEVLRRLDGKLEELGYTPDMILGPNEARTTANLSSLYSMQAERQIHENLLGPSMREQDQNDASNASASKPDDGVELF